MDVEPLSEVSPGHPGVAGQTVLVTGAAQGLGRALAARFHQHACNVVLADLDAERNGATAKAIDPEAERTQVLELDVRDHRSVESVFSAAVERWGKVEILINNAAVTQANPVWDINPQEWDEVLGVNLRGVFLMCRTFGAHMRDLGYGRIVNIASLAGQMARPSGAHYAASKAGVIALTRSFATELAGYGVTVNALAPGVLDTPMIRKVDPRVLAEAEATIPVGRIGSPDDVAALATFLASEQASYVTGATYDINGGVLMR